MGAQPTLGDLLATAHQTAAEVRTLGDYERAQMIVALQAEVTTQRFGHDLTTRRLADYFRAEVWRLARH
jgi:hypothetical protein